MEEEGGWFMQAWGMGAGGSSCKEAAALIYPAEKGYGGGEKASGPA